MRLWLGLDGHGQKSCPVAKIVSVSEIVSVAGVPISRVWSLQRGYRGEWNLLEHVLGHLGTAEM